MSPGCRGTLLGPEGTGDRNLGRRDSRWGPQITKLLLSVSPAAGKWWRSLERSVRILRTAQ